jgi:hypothetical protein
VPAGRARASRLGLLPRASEMGRDRRGPIISLGPAQRHLNKSVFISLFIILMKNTWENEFVVILAPKFVK